MPAKMKKTSPKKYHLRLAHADKACDGQAPSGSLQHAGRRAGVLLSNLQRAAGDSEHGFALTCTLMVEGLQVARDACAAAGIDWDEMLDSQPTLRVQPRALVKLPSKYSKAFTNAVHRIENAGTRYSTSTACRKAIGLIRIILTFKAATGLQSLIALPEEAPPTQPRSLDRAALKPTLTPSGRTRSVPQPMTAPPSPVYGDFALTPGWRDRLEEATARRRERFREIFLSMLAQAPPWEPVGPNGLCIPGWSWSPSLVQLREVYNEVLGPVRLDVTAREQIIPAHPLFLEYEPKIEQLWPHFVDMLLERSGEAWGAFDNGKRPAVFFPPALWEQAVTEHAGGRLPDWSAAVAMVNRKTRVVLADQVEPAYSHGIIRDIETAVLRGRHVLVFGAAGTGKSTLLKGIKFRGTVFELGDGLDDSLVGHNSYRATQFDQLCTKAGRTTGARVLIVHELVLTPEHLCRLGIFHQIVIVGDPRQPGPLPFVDHIVDFMKAIEAATFILPLVWRARNPNPFLFNSFLAYGSSMRIFRPSRFKTSKEDPEANDNSLTILSCRATPGMRAATMLAHAFGKLRHRRSVLIATDDTHVTAALEGLLNQLPKVPRALEFRRLSDLQGRSADVVIIDLLECAAHVPAVDEALRWWILLCGRARYSVALVIPQESPKPAPPQPLPLLACAAAYVHWRVRAVASDLPEYADLTSALAAVRSDHFVERLDEQTIAVTYFHVTRLAIVKDIIGSNVQVLAQEVCVVELPELFEEEAAHRSETVTRVARVISDLTLFKPGLTTLQALEDVVR